MSVKSRKRRFIPCECNHVYQRSVNGEIIFYDREDFLMFYMIVSVFARKRNILLLEMCLMYDHVHLLVEAESREAMADFVRDCTSVFVREYNTSIGRNGQLFHKSFGSAPKQGAKKMRSVIVYIGNNPVEKDLCSEAAEYQWNFLSYMVSSNPFSQDVPARKRSRALLRCMKRANAAMQAGDYLNYKQLYDMFSGLSESDSKLLTDYIVTLYNPFDERRLLSYYDDLGQMLDAMRSTAGSEHDLVEKWYTRSDVIYTSMISYVKDTLKVWPVRKVMTLPVGKRMQLAADLKLHTGASLHEIGKFLHLRLKMVDISEKMITFAKF